MPDCLAPPDLAGLGGAIWTCVQESSMPLSVLFRPRPCFEPAAIAEPKWPSQPVELEWPLVGEVVKRRVSDHRTIGRRGGHDVDLEMSRSIRGVAASRSESRIDSLRDADTLSGGNCSRLDP